jgi:hypothetical protein
MEKQPSTQYAHVSGHCGLAAILVAAVFLLMALPAFQLAFWLEASGYRGWSAADKRMAAYGGYGGTAVVVAFCLVGVIAGCRGLVAAGRTGEPRTLSALGVGLCLFAAAIWLLVGVAWHSQAWTFIKPA